METCLPKYMKEKFLYATPVLTSIKWFNYVLNSFYLITWPISIFLSPTYTLGFYRQTNLSTCLVLTSSGPQHTHETTIITRSWQIISIWYDVLRQWCLWLCLACSRVQLVSVLHTIDSSRASNPSSENRSGSSTSSQSLGSSIWKKHQLLELCTL